MAQPLDKLLLIRIPIIEIAPLVSGDAGISPKIVTAQLAAQAGRLASHRDRAAALQRQFGSFATIMPHPCGRHFDSDQKFPNTLLPTYRPVVDG
jgi:hypothetical protein